MIKEIKVIIRIDELQNKIGFLIEKDKEMDDSISQQLLFLGALQLLMEQQKNKIIKTASGKFEK